ncbi:STAS domain-containing protein [Streptomyces sp. NBC_01525]|uniref:Anti-sigma factor antagonist n=1 Tax=Streptomyces benahoarensis TaxID=2595054 RepID=A0A553ZM60_9ACTN|nr:STAS domain-containing protein [Streptomyces benahoarensis]TSB23679.1 STAS domain-containing protein [Streptomyces benahoarensis]TSB42558.1 STAS domain-containing protein [Streptomyces benahoarensis]
MNDDHTPTWPYLGRTDTTDGVTVVVLHGELDLLAARALAATLDDLTGTRRPDLVLDLRAVTFIDCSGLSLLCRARHRVRYASGRLRLTGLTPGDAVSRLLELTGLADAFDLLDTAAPGR